MAWPKSAKVLLNVQVCIYNYFACPGLQMSLKEKSYVLKGHAN